MKGVYLFKNLFGSFVLDKDFNVVKTKEHKGLKEPSGEKLLKAMEHFKQKKYFNEFYEKNLKLTKQKIKESFSEDILIVQATESIDELNKVINTLTKRLREWYAYHMPLFAKEVHDNEKFVELIATGDAKRQDAMAVQLSKDDLDAMTRFAKKIYSLYDFRKEQENYVQKKMKVICPNILVITGHSIGGKLIHLAGSLRKLALFPSSTVQLLGAERALFRHIRNKKYLPPKYGIIHEHQFITKAKNKGKAARFLADRITIAARVDFFKGKYVGDRLKKEIEAWTG